MAGLLDEAAPFDLRPTLAAGLPADYQLRERTPADLAFLSLLYASTRQDEMRLVDWSDEQKAAFLQDQFDKQHCHYLEHYPRAQWLVIECDGAPVGRIYLEQTFREIRLMDVALLPTARGKGVGSALVNALLAAADRLGLAVSLHVEPFNPAIRLYRRLGFVELETRGYYQFMERAARTATKDAS
jgi:ribosomal protein S18 acetylase RimI-like enzyme